MRKWISLWRNQQGFTLIELAVAVFVISVLIAIALPNLRGAGVKAQKVSCEGNQRLLRAQLENYYLTEKGYPTGTTDQDRIKSMVDLGYLQAAPSCPSGGTYSVTVSADKTSVTVSCSMHGVLGL
jgi:prepilin-type N-terminal cleavage/methylation domain-containing protein